MNKKTTFSKYMNSWLYSNDGYYANYKQIGKQGDFFTSVSISKFFGGAIANKIIKLIEKKKLPKNCSIIEIGAHHGYLLADVIQFIYTLNPHLLKTLNFTIIEKFDSLKEQQERYLKESFADAINLTHYKDISEIKCSSAFIFANEIFDAFACELVYKKNDKLLQAFIKDNTILFEETKDLNIIKHCKKYNITKGEICLDYKNFVNNLTSSINNFYFLTFDYGDKYPRNDFSCRIYKEHETIPIFDENINLEKLYKNSDVTYDVHFNYLKDLFEQNNCEVEFNTQANALIEFGIIELLNILRKNSDENTYFKETQKIKMLLEPTGMGDRFKILLIKK
ncbi:SAM-dependent methyltransferase [Malaciobacter molluscorum]|uniref:SAM-dependent methyltransferase n=1 Tax=Malaciobacter molluscorum TaxID=1032072 RepID=UPI001D1962F2|nr:SAM-dependent methyltransferase [Malaciobacter molluscorum]